jgi:hypothetical protein
VVYSRAMRDFHVIGIGEKGWGRFEIRLKVVTRLTAGWRGHASGFRRRSLLAIFFWICRILNSVGAAST